MSELACISDLGILSPVRADVSAACPGCGAVSRRGPGNLFYLNARQVRRQRLQNIEMAPHILTQAASDTPDQAAQSVRAAIWAEIGKVARDRGGR